MKLVTETKVNNECFRQHQRLVVVIVIVIVIDIILIHNINCSNTCVDVILVTVFVVVMLLLACTYVSDANNRGIKDASSKHACIYKITPLSCGCVTTDKWDGKNIGITRCLNNR